MQILAVFQLIGGQRAGKKRVNCLEEQELRAASEPSERAQQALTKASPSAILVAHPFSFFDAA